MFYNTRTLERAYKWTRNDSIDRPESMVPTERVKKAQNIACWGQAEYKEKKFYRRNKRCFKCGYKWELGDTCISDQGESKSNEQDSKKE